MSADSLCESFARRPVADERDDSQPSLRSVIASLMALLVCSLFAVVASARQSPEVLERQPEFAEDDFSFLGAGVDVEGNVAVLSAPVAQKLFVYTRSELTGAWDGGLEMDFSAEEGLAWPVAIDEEHRIYYASRVQLSPAIWEIRERDLAMPNTDVVVFQASQAPAEIDVDGNLLIVGWRADLGAGVVGFAAYERVGGTWMEQVSESYLLNGGVPTTLIGNAVSTDGVRFAVTDPLGATRGTVRVYRKDPTVFPAVWSLEDEVSYTNLFSPGDHDYGSAVAIDGDCLAVGMSRYQLGEVIARGGGSPGPGGVYLYRREPLPLGAGDWVGMRIVVPQSALDGDGFGYSVEMLGPNLVVGAPDAQRLNTTQPGDVSFYTRSGGSCADGTWTERYRLRSELLVNNTTAPGEFGRVVALSHEAGVLVGDLTGPLGETHGRGYVFAGVVSLFNDGFESGDLGSW